MNKRPRRRSRPPADRVKEPLADYLPMEPISGRIILLRGRKVMLSTHLAELYEVEPRLLMQAVRRNRDRFPPDFMFQLTPEEFADLKSHFVISSPGWGGARRAEPYAFTVSFGVFAASIEKRCPATVLRIPDTWRFGVRRLDAALATTQLDSHPQLT